MALPIAFVQSKETFVPPFVEQDDMYVNQWILRPWSRISPVDAQPT